MSDYLQPPGLQHASFLCPLLFSGVRSNSCSLTQQWCYLIISFSAVLFFCLKSFSCIEAFSNELALCIKWPKYWSFIYLFFTLFYFTILYWFCHTSTWICHECTHVPNPEPPSHLPSLTISLGHPGAPAPSILYASLNLDWWFISYMILFMFQCHSPKSSHPLLLPQSPKDCSIHLCLFCCLAYRVIITIFLNSIYMR